MVKVFHSHTDLASALPYQKMGKNCRAQFTVQKTKTAPVLLEQFHEILFHHLFRIYVFRSFPAFLNIVFLDHNIKSFVKSI